MSPPFEPLGSISLQFLTLKVVFLVAITSARRVFEIAALSVRSDLCIFHSNRVVLRMDPSFLPKVNSLYHRSQELVLPDFCPDPRHRLEAQWHTLDVQQALCRYIKQTAPFRRFKALFVSLPASMGRKVSSSTISCWIKACIGKVYALKNKPLPGHIPPHSRSASTMAAWATQASVIDICRVATWTSLTSFICHYKVDSFASADVSFGRRVLQTVHSTPATREHSAYLPP